MIQKMLGIGGNTGGSIISADKVSFDNTLVQIPNNPQDTQSAIAEIATIQDLTSDLVLENYFNNVTKNVSKYGRLVAFTLSAGIITSISGGTRTKIASGLPKPPSGFAFDGNNGQPVRYYLDADGNLYSYYNVASVVASGQSIHLYVTYLI